MALYRKYESWATSLELPASQAQAHSHYALLPPRPHTHAVYGPMGTFIQSHPRKPAPGTLRWAVAILPSLHQPHRHRFPGTTSGPQTSTRGGDTARCPGKLSQVCPFLSRHMAVCLQEELFPQKHREHAHLSQCCPRSPEKTPRDRFTTDLHGKRGVV